MKKNTKPIETRTFIIDREILKKHLELNSIERYYIVGKDFQVSIIHPQLVGSYQYAFYLPYRNPDYGEKKYQDAIGFLQEYSRKVSIDNPNYDPYEDIYSDEDLVWRWDKQEDQAIELMLDNILMALNGRKSNYTELTGVWTENSAREQTGKPENITFEWKEKS